jgi:LysM repeat protein
VGELPRREVSERRRQTTLPWGGFARDRGGDRWPRPERAFTRISGKPAVRRRCAELSGVPATRVRQNLEKFGEVWQRSEPVLKRYLYTWLLATAIWAGAGTAAARSNNTRQVHVVYEGQRLGSIAKRYNVTIEALCEANGIRRRDPIRPGQRLEIPSREETARKQTADKPAANTGKEVVDKPGPTAAKVETHQDTVKTAASKTPAGKAAASKTVVTKAQATKAQAASKSVTLASVSAQEPTFNSLANLGPTLRGISHRVEPGESLSAIARRYDTSIKTLLLVNNLKRDQVIRVGQVLQIPRPITNMGSWVNFARAPRRAGEVEVFALGNRWKGKVVFNGKVQSSARAALSRLLGATGSAPPVPERLIQLLAHVSDTFGGRPIRLVSGYRTSSYFKDSRHKHSSAVDFSIPGVPNSAVRDYLLQLGNVGVGYYPNSSFVHLDVRARSAYWVDYAGPGEAPRRKPRGETRLAINTSKSRRNAATRASLRRNAAAVATATSTSDASDRGVAGSSDVSGGNTAGGGNAGRAAAVSRGASGTAANTGDTTRAAEPTLSELDALAERAVKEIDAPPPPGPRAQSGNSPNPAVL